MTETIADPEVKKYVPVVIYHGGGCRDGFCAAWVMWKHFKGAVELIPANYGEEPTLEKCDGREVYVVDFCYPRECMVALLGIAKSLTVLDHHKTARDTLLDLLYLPSVPIGDGSCIRTPPFVVFDVAKSGARLAWDWTLARSKDSTNQFVPWLVRYTEDRDLWRHGLYATREINAVLRTKPLDLHVWDELNATLPESLIGAGKAILEAEQAVVDSHCKHAVRKTIAGHNVPVVNATTLISEIGHQLCQGEPFSATYFDDLKSGHRRYSLRSAFPKPGAMDVSEVAQTFPGGGGHPNAAGFEMRLTGADGFITKESS